MKEDWVGPFIVPIIPIIPNAHHTSSILLPLPCVAYINQIVLVVGNISTPDMRASGVRTRRIHW